LKLRIRSERFSLTPPPQAIGRGNQNAGAPGRRVRIRLARKARQIQSARIPSIRIRNRL